MDPIDYWRLSNEFSVVQAALIIVGSDPNDLQYWVENNDHKRPQGYTAVRTALVNAIRTGALNAVVVEEESFGRSSIDVHETLVGKAALDQFVKSRGYVSEFFSSPGAAGSAADANGRFFSRKLDAANKAWAAVTSDPARLVGKSPKQALRQWLIEHAAELSLLNRDGTPNTTGIEEVCKVANWKPEGGATATPNGPSPTQTPNLIPLPPQKPAAPPPRESFAANLDDEIPFWA